MNKKQLVEQFFTSIYHKSPDELKSYLHPELVIFWNNSAGFRKMDFETFTSFIAEMAKSFQDINCNVSHLLQEEDEVAIRFSYQATPIEDPDEEMNLGNFMAISEFKQDKIHQIYLISQPADNSVESLESFFPKK